MKFKLTPWFNGNIKPVHVGVYQRVYVTGFRYSYWNGKFWCSTWDDFTQMKSSWQSLQWRGILK